MRRRRRDGGREERERRPHATTLAHPPPSHSLSLCEGDANIKIEWKARTMTQRPIQPKDLFSRHALPGSPFSLAVAPGPMDPQASYARGGALTDQVTGYPHTFTIVSRDAYGPCGATAHVGRGMRPPPPPRG